jgi:hypothetical protein
MERQGRIASTLDPSRHARAAPLGQPFHFGSGPAVAACSAVSTVRQPAKRMGEFGGATERLVPVTELVGVPRAIGVGHPAFRLGI